MVADVTGKPTFITRYRIQLGKNDPVSISHSASSLAERFLQALRLGAGRRTWHASPLQPDRIQGDSG